jgi:hypothetical protein
MHKITAALTIGISVLVSGCGVTVPTLRTWPDNYSDSQNNAMVQAILRSIRCELRNAVTIAVDADYESALINGDKPSSIFLDSWGVEALLTLTIKEKTSFSPTGLVNINPISTIAGGIGLSAEATREEKINTFYTVKELYLRKGQTCTTDRNHSNGSLLVSNDLEVANLLAAKIDSVALGQAGGFASEGQKNVLQHRINFQTIYSGDITPSVRIVRGTFNTSGPFLRSSRDQSHELLATFGPLARTPAGPSLAAVAEQTHFASQITSGVTRGFQAAFGP